MTSETVIQIPEPSLVVLIGISGSGKSTFAAKHFLATEVLSSDTFRGLVSDDDNDQSATRDAFSALNLVASLRLQRRKLVVVDATNVKADSRRPLLELAASHDLMATAIVIDVPERVAAARNAERTDRNFGSGVIRNQARQLRESLRSLKREGFRHIFRLEQEQIDAAHIIKVPLWTDRRIERGPFDVVGDVHGCFDELQELLSLAGYVAGEGPLHHPGGRRAIFLGDLVDRGPRVVETVRLVVAMVAAGSAFCLPGNHDDKLLRALQGRPVRVSHGLQDSLDQIEALPEPGRGPFREQYIRFVSGLVAHLWLDDGKLCVAHAGIKEEYIGRASARVREFALYGDTTGETDEYGLPVRYPWARDYRGGTAVVYGHTPVPEANWLNNTINIDTGCVFGGRLTLLRWPERELLQVAARATYATPARPLAAPETEAAIERGSVGAASALVRAEGVLGKQFVETRLMGAVMVPAENNAAALEAMSRFAVDPRWLITLPPTMSPCETAPDGDLLERPVEAFAYYRSHGVRQVICERKHMGSRAVLVICRDEAAAVRRFGVSGIGQCWTRTGRQFFAKPHHAALLAAAADAAGRAGLWEELETDWICLDCEIMPWNAKARELLREQYAPVGAAATVSLDAAAHSVAAAAARGMAVGDTLAALEARQRDIALYRDAYAQYCWPVSGLDGIRVAPFHILASEGQVYFDRAHAWHLAALARLADCSPAFIATESRLVDLEDDGSSRQASAWWEELTAAGGEGMVVKPAAFTVRGKGGLLQPAVKVRGREYLRIIYGPEYTEEANLLRLRGRGLGKKRSLALREFALGAEALERFVRHEALSRVHECVFGVLALESEPVDPRL